jgi:hypothetical protein
MTSTQTTRYFRTIEELQAIHAEAATMTASCPICSGNAKVMAAVRQATRQEPARFLGFDGFCVPCQMAFPIDNAQLALA